MRDISARMAQIGRKVSLLKNRREKRLLALLSTASLALCFGIGVLLRFNRQPVRFTVQTSYGSVLLHNGGDAYVVTAVFAFLAGTTLTIILLRLTQTKRPAQKRR